MRITTQHCGIVNIAPKNVAAIWSENVLADERFTHSIDVRDEESQSGHRVFGITEETAGRISRVSGVAISKMEFESYDDTYDGDSWKRSNGHRHSPSSTPPMPSGNGKTGGQNTLYAWTGSGREQESQDMLEDA